tara:strand:+ start:63116 stop:67732 length:4617 start_codon:yes stop_codon:yes gene_type:complete
MEAGKLSLSATTSLTQLQAHTFQQIYDTPPIVIALPTSAGGNASAVRISNVSTTGFRMSSVEPRSEDGPHTNMTVSYIAIEAGSHTFPNGEVIEAGIVSTDKIQFNGKGKNGWEKLSFANKFNKPVFLANIQTTANEINAIPRSPSHPWLTVAIDKLRDDKTDIALERSEVYDQVDKGKFEFNDLANPESIGYVIMDRGLIGNFLASNNIQIKFETLYNTNTIDGWSDGCDNVSYAGSYSATPIVVATMSSRNEKDGGWLRECSVNSSRIQLTVDEDTSQDSERNHSKEDASLLIFSSSFYYDSTPLAPIVTSNNLMLESNLADLAPNTFTSINFDQIYDLPPAVFILEDNQNPEPSSVRIRNITKQGFQVVPVEPDSRVTDASDQTTTIQYLAISKGEFAFPDGKKIEVGPTLPPKEIANFQAKRLPGDSWFRFNFVSAFSSTPTLLSQIQTMNNEAAHSPGSPSQPWMTTAVRNVTSSGGDIALDRAETNTGTLSVAEEIAFLATEAGIIGDFKSVSGKIISSEAQVTPDNVAGTRNCYNYNFLQAYLAAPLVIGSQMTWDGGDGGWLRRCSTTTNRVSIKIEEDWASDTDNAHTTERAGFLAFSEVFHADFSLVANYQLEGPNWLSAGDVIDSSNSGLNGQAIGDARPYPAKVCNGVLLDGDGDYIVIPDSPVLDISDELTVMAWVKPSAFPASDLMTIVSKDTNFEFHIDPTGKVLWWWNNSSGASRSFTSNNTSLTLDQWHHVAITYSKSAGSQKIFIDGVETNTQSYANESLINNSLPLFIGTDYNYRSRDFNGNIDEVKIFKRALSSSAIQKHASETRPCASCTLSSFDISQPTYALACPDTRAEIDITARCVDGTVKTDYTGTVLLTAPSGATFFDNDIAGNEITSLSYSFSDKGQKQAYLYFNNEEDDVKVTTNDTSASISSTPADGDGTDFKAFGFRVAQQPSNFVCTTSTNMTLEAYGKTDISPSCAVLTGFNGDKKLDVWFRATLDDDATPDNIVNSNLTVAGKTISAQNDDAFANENLTLNFTNGTSSFNLSYPNAAKFIDLNFKLDSAPYDMAASTQSFVAYPERFLITAKSDGTDINGSSSSSSITHKAGQAFELELTAQCKAPDGKFSTASDYQPTDATTGLMTYLQRTGPIDGNSVDGKMPISFSTTLDSNQSTSIIWQPSGLGSGDFDKGVYTYKGASFSEVGLTRLFFKDASYFGIEIPQSTQNSIDIGRFIPSYFEVTVDNNGSLAAFCDIGSASDFSYIGQTIEYLSTPSIKIQAYNSMDDITQNYTEGSFLKLTTEEDKYIELTFPDMDATSWGLDGITKLAINSNYSIPGSFSSAINGTVIYSFLNSDSFVYSRDANSLVKPFFSTIEIIIDNIRDEDNVESNAEPYKILPSAIQLRYGRWAMDNAFGPETQDLAIPMRIESWTGSSFSANTSDNCSTYSASDMIVKPSLSGGSTTLSRNGTLIFGEAPLSSQLSLSAPGANNTGTVKLEFDVDSWLQYDWDNNPITADTNPKSVASFGQYRGHDRIIYWREVSQ